MTTEAMREARRIIARDRQALWDSHVNQHTGKLEDADALPFLEEYDAALAKLDAAMAAQPEPVAWMDDFGNVFPLGANKGAGSWRDEHKRNWRPLYTAPQAAQPREPADALNALARLWPLFERSTKGYVFTAERAGEVMADMNKVRAMLAAAPTAPEAGAAPRQEGRT